MNLPFFKRREQEPERRGDCRILVMADMHCGHRCGLTPPRWWDDESFKWGKLQRVLWNHYADTIRAWKPFDLVLVNGDMIDGRGDKGVQHITTNPQEQAEIAAECIMATGGQKVRMTYGTPFHVGAREDGENNVCLELLKEGIDAKIRGHLLGSVYGVEINMRHKVEASTVPYGRGTAIAKHDLWNEIWAQYGVQDRAGIIIRSHVHYYHGPVDNRPLGPITLITPSLQGLGDKFGSRQCVGVVHFGLVMFIITPEGEISWKKSILEGKAQKEESEVLFAVS